MMIIEFCSFAALVIIFLLSLTCVQRVYNQDKIFILVVDDSSSSTLTIESYDLLGEAFVDDE